MNNRFTLVVVVLMLLFLLPADAVWAQCSICTKTASQMGREAAAGLNQGIVYLMGIPFVIAGLVGYRYWKEANKPHSENE